MTIDPWDFSSYLPEAKWFSLNGVHQPFWQDWPLAKPSLFLTPEPLHHWHKWFWDHNAKWCIQEVGGIKLNFHFLVLQPHVWFCHFPEGISNLKQAIECEHHNVQHYIVGVIAGAVTWNFLIVIHANMDFCYVAQAEEINEDSCEAILASINKFHQQKSGIMNMEAQVGKGNRPINNWYIPKLELMQSIVPNIQANGTAIQYSTNATKHAHITKIKNPTCSGNNQHYETQICHDLDHTYKLCQFYLAISIHESHIDLSNKSKDHNSSETDVLQQADPSADNNDNAHFPLGLTDHWFTSVLPKLL